MSEVEENSLKELLATGQSLYSQNKFKEAIAKYKTALIMPQKLDNSTLAAIYIKLANAYYRLNDVAQYTYYYEEYLKMYPEGQASIFTRLAQAYTTIDLDKSIDYRNKSLNLDVSEYDVICKIFALTKSSFYSQEEIKAEAEYEVGQLKNTIYKDIKQFDFSQKKALKNKKLNIGYLSSDCYTHIMMEYILPLWQNHNQEKYNFFIFNCSDKEDVTTEKIVSLGFKVIKCKGLNKKEIAQTIYENDIDILVDIGGYTQMNSLVSLYKPAPIIISYLGYLNTMGMREMDYILADRFMVPEEFKEMYTEKILYLDTQYQIFTKKTKFPEVSGCPFEKNGYITFGSFNCTSKMSYATLFLWSKILKEYQPSKLLIYRTQMTKKHIQTLKDKFKEFGVDESRIIFDSKQVSPLPKAYSNADISLDTFPFSGMSIAKECALMGVPTVSLSSEKMQSRGASNVNELLGLKEFNTTCGDEYIKQAISLAQNKEKLRELRILLREKLLNSPICTNYKNFALDVERAYEYAWKNFVN